MLFVLKQVRHKLQICFELHEGNSLGNDWYGKTNIKYPHRYNDFHEASE
jgi:hypothetical protein